MPGWDDFVDERSGGLLLKYQSKNVDVFFVENKFGKPQLTIEAYLTHPEDYPRISEGMIHNWFSVPSGWVIVDDGKAVQATEWIAANGNPQEAPEKFRGDSDIGRLVTQMKIVDPTGATLAHGNPTQAAYWKAALSGITEWDGFTFAKRVQNEAGEWVDDPKGKQLSLPVSITTIGNNGQAPAEFDIQSLGADPTQLDILRQAAIAAKNVGEFQAAIIQPLAGQPVLGAVMKQPGDVYASLLVS